MAERDSGGDIQVLARCAQILRAVQPGERINLSRLAAELEVGRSTLHRYLQSMANLDFIARTHDGEYVLGPLLAKLGAVALNRNHVIDAASARIRELRDQLRETIVLSVWGGQGAVVSLVEAPASLIQILVRVGSELPYNAAQATVFLAHLPAETVDRIVPPGHQYRARLDEQIAKTRQDGHLSVTGFIDGLETLAVPVFDATGIVAAIATVGTERNFEQARRQEVLDALRETAAQISAALGSVQTEVDND